MAVSVTMPRLGESVSEGTVTRWLKNEGDRVEADEPLLEVSTDKVDTEIPSPAGGVLKSIKVGEDETVEVGSELAVIDDGAGGGDGGGATQEDQQDKQPEPEPEAKEPEPEAKQEQPQPQADDEPKGERAAPAEQREQVAAQREQVAAQREQVAAQPE